MLQEEVAFLQKSEEEIGESFLPKMGAKQILKSLFSARNAPSALSRPEGRSLGPVFIATYLVLF